MTAAIQNTLLVKVQEQIYALPDKTVVEVLDGEHHEIQFVQGQTSILLRDQFLPTLSLAELLNIPEGEDNINHDLVILQHDQNQLGIFVSKVMYREELFLKDLHSHVAQVPGLGGVSILGNGQVVLILDTEQIFGIAQQKGLKIMQSISTGDSNNEAALH